ncbi:MAG: DUF4446 family protein [Anaerovibrio sp.]|uniref:DUF4446 family protein n=1 Tax=uncultured Anaerovibrio sp. TaxID=361586 RepID=UPI002600DB91|nr:DUF4446 family protein [uncultured Anaerovibrio sp.]MBQ3854249.1 DUF4446 family protein [Anaerovibrio sp.]
MENTEIMKFIINNLSYVVATLGILMIVMYLLMINLFYNLNYMKKRYKKMMTGVDGANLERLIIGCVDDAKAVSEENQEIKRNIEDIRALLQQAITKVAVVRFRAFEDMGSDLSYAVAMLDSDNNGVIMSSIFGREDSRSYVKPITAGKSSYPMTDEEEDALKQAMRQH